MCTLSVTSPSASVGRVMKMSFPYPGFTVKPLAMSSATVTLPPSTVTAVTVRSFVPLLLSSTERRAVDVRNTSPKSTASASSLTTGTSPSPVMFAVSTTFLLGVTGSLVRIVRLLVSLPAYMPSTAFAVMVISFSSPTPMTPLALESSETIDVAGARMRIAEPVVICW